MTSISTSRSTRVLQDARDAAASSSEYSSARTREDLVNSFKETFSGLEPYSWQLDVAEALILGLDCIAIAGTRSGKTMPFAMPLLVDRTQKKMVIVISPLNDLEDDQVCLLISLRGFSHRCHSRLADSKMSDCQRPP
jgi:ATP-dependent helicase YprA (DUF1998 family)